jgi:antitoxin MazE
MQVSKWGNSLAVRLPKSVVERMKLSAGDELAVREEADGSVTLAKIDRRAAFLKAMEPFRFNLPEGYKFDREEANRR